MILFPNFYRMHGLRLSNQLTSPRLNLAETLALPQASVFHSINQSADHLCIGVDDPWLAASKGAIFLEHQTDIATHYGNPRHKVVSTAKVLNAFIRKNRRMRLTSDIGKSLSNSNSTLVENYDLLPRLWYYTGTSPMIPYFAWQNTQATLVANIKRIASVLPSRQQFIPVRIPQIIPSLQMLQKAESKMTNGLVKTLFNTPESLFLFDLFRWLGDNREASVLGTLTAEELNKINLLIVESGHWLVINLGYLDNWRKGHVDAPEEGDSTVVEGDGKHADVITPKILQKRVLRIFMTMMELRTDMGVSHTDSTTNEEKAASEPAIATTDKAVVGLTPDTKPVEVVRSSLINSLLGKSSPAVEPIHVDGQMVSGVAATAAAAVTTGMAEIDEAIDKDLDALNHLMTEEIDESDTPDEVAEPVEVIMSTIPDYVPHVTSLEEGIMKRAEGLAKMGRMSGAEYRRAERLSNAYKSIPDPRGSDKTLSETAVIDPASLAIVNTPRVPDLPEVMDKSMLSSATHEFDTKYITEIMPKDVTNAVLGIQKAGIAVTGYTIVQVEDAGNHYEEHSVKIEPLQGNRTTLKFRLPVVKPNGTFKAGGVQYRQRKQRNEVPIRKDGPSEVALSSYYGKLFVLRGEKKVNDYPNWLITQLGKSQIIEHPAMSDVAVLDIVLPKDYTTIAGKYQSFTAKGVAFNFDYKKRQEMLKGVRMKADSVEGSGSVLVGTRGGSSDGNLVIMDRNSELHELTKGKWEALGTMEEFLGFESAKAPLEIAEIVISGKNVPLGLVLSYYLGFHGLIKHLNVPFRQVKSGTRLNLEMGEYALRFEDDTYIFNRRHKKAALILGSFTSMADTIKHYVASSLDSKDSYFNLLDDEGLGVRVLREMELLNDMFIDPITLEILKDMGEPQDFIGLLLKAAEMLEIDFAPAPTDFRYMRVRGYERMAGAVYNQLVRSIRLHRARPGMMGSTVELAPFAIWQDILQDPAISSVEESNPVHNVKEKEEVTFSGVGGRSSRSMTKSTRVFHENDKGIISEATKDSSDVAITTFMTADPALTNLRGMTKRYDKEKDGPARLLSTPAMLAPGITHDDQLGHVYQ